jgi:damage-control phosphatase, subfamily I
MSSSCYSCILDRAKFEADLVLKTEAEKTQAMEELLAFMADNKGGVPALVGTQREVIIKRRSKNVDPYHDLKSEANQVAEALLPAAERFYSQSKDKLEALIRIAAAANSMEFGVKGHNFENATFGKVFCDILGENLYWDLSEIKKRLERFENILYLTDNSGEAIFDLFVIEKLKEMGKRVVIASKSEPILNDVTAYEMRSFTDNKVIPAGPVVGTWLDEITPELSAFLFDKDWLVISKGMGNFETMSEYDCRLVGRLIYILRAKCEPVAAALGVAKGSLVAKAI